MIEFIAAGIWRLIEGSDLKGDVPAIAFHLSLAMILGGIYAQDPSWQLAVACIGAAVNINLGQTAWKDWGWMPLRYSGVAALFCLPYGLDAVPYVAACIGCGVLCPTLFWVEDKLVAMPRWKLLDGPEAYARIVAGATIIGGLTLL